MRTRITKSRNYNKKVRKNAKLKTQPQEFDEPVLTTHQAAFKLNVANPADWYKLFNIKYYKQLLNIYNIIWSNIYNKSGNILLETQTKVANFNCERYYYHNKKNEKKHLRTKKVKEKTVHHQQTQMKV